MGANIGMTIGNEDNTLQLTGTAGMENTRADTSVYTDSTVRSVAGLAATYRPTRTSEYSLRVDQPAGSDTVATVAYRSGYGKVSYSNANGGTVFAGLDIPLGRQDGKNSGSGIFTPVPGSLNVRQMANTKPGWLPTEVNT